jgi:exodeoxyribonuclease VII small subunit
MTKTPQNDISTMTFEQALAELEAIVRRLEGGQGELEKSIEDYTRGNALRAHCQAKLKDAQLRVDKIIKQTDGTLATEPFAVE